MESPADNSLYYKSIAKEDHHNGTALLWIKTEFKDYKALIFGNSISAEMSIIIMPKFIFEKVLFLPHYL